MRLGCSYKARGKTSFNPRICKRCDFVCAALAESVASFNPRICKRCDLPLLKYLMFEVVSIHASVKDATKRQDAAIKAQRVSIHASVKDATK